MTTFDEYKKEFMEDLEREFQANGVSKEEYFAQKFCFELSENGELWDFNAAYYAPMNTRVRYKVDGYSYNEEDRIFTLVVADFDIENEKKALTKSNIESTLLFRAVRFIKDIYEGVIKLDFDEYPAIHDLIDVLKENRSEIRKFNILIITNGEISKSLKQLDTEQLDGKEVNAQVWGFERIYDLISSQAEGEPVQIDFTDFTSDGDGLPCIKASGASTNDYDSYLCVIPGSVLADLYDKYGGKLLEGNVRSFLTNKNSANKDIRNTIKNHPENFFVFNNGISATAIDIEINAKNSCLYSVKKFQIINGGQTTASLADARFDPKLRADLSKIYVQMKLTVIHIADEEKTSKLIENISKSSNTQSKVNASDFFSNHPYHVAIEKISRRITTPLLDGKQYGTYWYYERTRGQYLQEQRQLTEARKNTFKEKNPKKQLISKLDLAKVLNSWDGKPNIVSKGAQTNFANFAGDITKKWKTDDEDEKAINKFNESYFKESVALIIIWKKLEELVSDQDWYKEIKSYRANIVTYSLAMLRVLINRQFSGYYLDYNKIWNSQDVPNQILSAFEYISEEVYEHITDDKREQENVTQWCKTEKCWTRMKNSFKYTLPDSFENVLMTKDKYNEFSKSAKKDQAMVTNFNHEARVYSIPERKWKFEIRPTADKLRLLTPELNTAISFVRTASPYQCKKLSKLLDALKEEGYEY